MKSEIKSTSEILRQKAEESIKSKPSTSSTQLTRLDIQKLLHELEVHQIELEMQNDELIQAKKDALHEAERYTDLYDFAPTGYFTLSKEGIIFELNLYGSQMLGKERLYIINRRFGLFVSDESKPVFDIFLEKVFKSRVKETCELYLSCCVNSPKYVFLTGIISDKREQCLVTAVDITERKLAEIKLQEKMNELEDIFRLTSGDDMTIANLKKEVNELLKKLGQDKKY